MVVFEFSSRSSLFVVILAFFMALSSFTQAEVVGVYKAEDAILDDVDLEHKHDGYTGEAYADFGGYGASMTWKNVVVPSSGSFHLSVRYASASRRPADLIVDGSKVASFAFLGTDSWKNWYTETIFLNLDQGIHTITIYASVSKGPNVDKMTLEFASGRNEDEDDEEDGFSIKLQPEDASSNRNVDIRDNNDGYEDWNGFADYGGSGAYLAWNVEVPSTENYIITARYAANNARPSSLFIDGKEIGNFAFGPTGSWDTWRTESKYAIMYEGSHTIMIRADESSGPNLDWVTVQEVVSAPTTVSEGTPDGFSIPTNPPAPVPQPTPRPTPSKTPAPVQQQPTSPGEVVYQPEDAVMNQVVIRDQQDNYDGDNGYADFGGVGAYLSWNVRAPASGYYRVRCRYAAGSDRPAELRVNGRSVGTFKFDETRSWDEWEFESMDVYLGQGANMLMIYAKDSTGPNLDWMSVMQISSSPQLTDSPTRKPTPAPVSNDGLPPSDFREVTVIRSNSRLNRGEFVSSPSGAYKVGLTSGGNFVLQDSRSRTIWSSGTSDGYRLYMQSDGNLILRTSSGKARWKSRTYNNPGATFVLDDGGQIAVKSASHGEVVWLDGIPRGTYRGPSSQSLKYPLRGTFYYPWYPETWTVGGKLAHFKPTIGYYSSSDPKVVESHLDALEYAHVDVNIASWWGVETNLDRARLLLRMDRTIKRGSKDEMDGDPSVSAIRSDLGYLKKWFAWHPAWAHIDGKPVIFIWNESDCEVVKRWMTASNNEWYVITKLFGDYRDCPVQPDHWHQYGVGDGTLEYRGVSFTIGPGFWKANKSKPDKPRVGKDTWCRNVKEMVESGQPWQLIVSFNEAGEGTMIESSPSWASSSGHGHYLDCLHQFS
eukprot:scaffold3987_cov134-Cylindrotheca_fusiformis.AAC.9